MFNESCVMYTWAENISGMKSISTRVNTLIGYCAIV